ncbi:MAG: GtrA family protein [Chloroflexota bacterium]
MILTNPQERLRFIRFSIVGTVGAGVDFGTFNLLVIFLGVPAVIASVCSFLVAVTSNFIWNRYWTYPDSRTKEFSKQWLQFTLVNVVGLFIRTPIFSLLHTPLRRLFSGWIVQGSADFWGHNIALGIAIIVVLFWNFFANRFWTYSDVDA